MAEKNDFLVEAGLNGSSDVKHEDSHSLSSTDVDSTSMDMIADDKVLYEQMRIINNTIDEIGLTAYHWKLFCLNGMGYATDSTLTFIQSLTLAPTQKEFDFEFPGPTMALYGGMLLGAIIWGFSADIIGRKFAFNSSLILSAVFAMIAAGMPNLAGYCVLVAMSAAAAGGNLVLDTTVFLEFLPSSQQWLLTLLAAWWGVGQLIAVLVIWPFMANYQCESKDYCPKHINMGWRYSWITLGGMVLILGILRITVIRLIETPKFNLCEGNVEQVVKDLHKIANAGGKTISLTVEQLEACGKLDPAQLRKNQKWKWVKDLGTNVKLLFANRKLAQSTTILWISWTVLGIAYPLYSSFLPAYLSSRGAQTGGGTIDDTYRAMSISNTFSIFGPVLAAILLFVPKIPLWGRFYIPAPGRRGAMCIGALLTMTFFFAYTTVKTEVQNVAFSSVTSLTIYTYYGTLYAFTPEVMPSRARATGNGIAIAFTRLAGIMSPLIAYYGDTSSSIPIYVCAACYGALGLGCFLYPFEPMVNRAM
ncbi:major facilitator superfamily domain-containing protein [Yarrowia lipolytica]|jgi:MFS family permease|uniref:YALI0B19008p n=2 Tax=Yarrowia lipolytica TaxID=4952 RepID=Q6CE30_YARLI|nr:YALI0B19008p [Yarrowia lipolytica CLIB122]AOW01917.1 hypothetical protein YALI1_B24901g [Yarrowia lipolytica]KAB8282501.1 major facilitator superfamily domain-containing protein [Yarrowia lipolytica]KAE8170831.1 major facilitator superfamily domain-containing protein [Yarrowia lipolytica]KAJ8052698.1 major facilitator superfamily domain-containing protein [Yarrowia lipolytica]QNP96866.1 MFS siderochrome iron transporter 1 [Yarrowia lipolytica]|eukprot:XP_501082.1 YALI0B19008p [Yarrowia lipolytica CLIB122]